MPSKSLFDPDSRQLQARLLRRSWRRARQSMLFGLGSLQHSPVLFANSFPKSGTHLLTQILQGFSAIGPAVDSGLPAIVSFNGETGQPRSEAEIVSDLQRLLPGDIAYGHVHALPRTIQFLTQENVAAYFIVRDPRDVVVSHVHYITEMAEQHIHHEYFNQKLPDFEARLSASIAGVSIQDLTAAGIVKTTDRELPDIRARFEPFIPWLDCSQVMLIRFEELINDRRRQLMAIVAHATAHGFHLSMSEQIALDILEKHINPQKSPTFRSGKTGGWKTAFSPQHNQLFKIVSKDLLQRLGYEDNHDW